MLNNSNNNPENPQSMKRTQQRRSDSERHVPLQRTNRRRSDPTPLNSIAAISLLLLFALLSVPSTQAADPAQTGPGWLVNNATRADDGVCSVAHCSLPEAINASNNDSVDSRIWFAAGISTIEASPCPATISCLPAIDSKTILDGNGTVTIRGDGNTTGGALLRIGNDGWDSIESAAGAVIRNITLANHSDTAMYFDGANNATIENFTIRDVQPSQSAIHVRNADFVVVSNGTVENGSWGIITQTEPHHLTIESVTFLDQDHGSIAFLNGTGHAARNNTIIGSGYSGILIQTANDTLLANNQILAGLRDGVNLLETNNATLVGNRIGVASNGTADGNQLSGINITRSSNVTIGTSESADENIIGSNSENGILIINSTNVTIERNRIGLDANGDSRPNDGDGINVDDDTTDLRITRNLIHGNGGTAISRSLPIAPTPTSLKIGSSINATFTVGAASAPAGGIIEVFSSPACPSDGGGKKFIASVNSTGAGSYPIPKNLFTVGHWITATFTNSDNETGSYSSCAKATSTVKKSGGSGGGGGGGGGGGSRSVPQSPSDSSSDGQSSGDGTSGNTQSNSDAQVATAAGKRESDRDYVSDPNAYMSPPANYAEGPTPQPDSPPGSQSPSDSEGTSSSGASALFRGRSSTSDQLSIRPLDDPTGIALQEAEGMVYVRYNGPAHPGNLRLAAIDDDGNRTIISQYHRIAVWNTTLVEDGFYRIQAEQLRSDGLFYTLQTIDLRVDNPDVATSIAVGAAATGAAIAASGSLLSTATTAGISMAKEGAIAYGEDAMREGLRRVRDAKRGAGGLVGLLIPLAALVAALFGASYFWPTFAGQLAIPAMLGFGAVYVSKNAVTRSYQMELDRANRQRSLGALAMTISLFAIFFTIEGLSSLTASEFVAKLPLIGGVVASFMLISFANEWTLAIAAGTITRFRLLWSGIFTLAFSAVVFRTAFGYPGYVDEEDGHSKEMPRHVSGMRALATIWSIPMILLPYILAGAMISYTILDEGLNVGLAALAALSMPVRPLPGHELYQWNKPLSIFMVVVTFLLFLGYEAAFLTLPVLLWLGVFGWLLFSLTVTWLFVRQKEPVPRFYAYLVRRADALQDWVIAHEPKLVRGVRRGLTAIILAIVAVIAWLFRWITWPIRWIFAHLIMPLIVRIATSWSKFLERRPRLARWFPADPK